ncbi:MAG TPA: hypothetical protein VHX13_13110 [Acidobacteriaceae bacterium]|jgi:integrase|nr:hypothetical protein [Acidobacteriaceae bacterium]
MRLQSGHIYEAAGAFFVRYRDNQIVEGKRVRVQRSHRLCTKDGIRYRSVKDKNVKILRDAFMLKVNERNALGRINTQEVKIVDFWDQTYLPFIQENLRPSTVHGYKKVWTQHLLNHFSDLTLHQYRTHIGSHFLTTIAGKPLHLGRHTLAHVRSVASGLFTHAVNRGVTESNPWHDVKVLGKVKEPQGTTHYTLEQAVKMIGALKGHPDCQAILALSCFLGLRPGEIAGLQWPDIDDNWIHIRRAVVRGIVGATKTRIKAAADQLCSCGLPLSSCQRLPLIAPVAQPLSAWRKMSGDPTEGWVLSSRSGNPVNLAELNRRVIAPILNSQGIRFKGLYPGRRGAATILTELTGSAIAAQQLLRHQDLAVTTKNYVQMIPEALLSAVKLLEAKVTSVTAGS